MPSNKVILGFTGLAASGKGTSAKYFEQKYGVTTYRFSTMLRDLLNRIYVEPSRDNLIRISEFVRGAYGEDIMAKVMAKDVERDQGSLIIVDGIRRMADIEYLSKIPGFVLVEIFADIKTRYERLVARRENTDDATKTFAQFEADHQRSTELSILDVVPHATEHVDNNGTVDQLHAQLDSLVQKYAGKR